MTRPGLQVALLLAGLALAAGLTWPLPLRLGSDAQGPGQSGVQYWLVHEARESLARGHLPPDRDDSVLHPQGLAVPRLGCTQRLAAAAASVVLPVQGAVHLVLVAALALAWVATYLLLRREGCSAVACVGGATLFTASPFQLGLVARGEAWALSSFWLPVLLLALDRWLSERRMAGLLAALVACNCLVLEGPPMVLPAAALAAGWLLRPAGRSGGWRPSLTAVFALSLGSLGLLVAQSASCSLPADGCLSVLDWGRPDLPLARPDRADSWRVSLDDSRDGPFPGLPSLALRGAASPPAAPDDLPPRVTYLGAVALALSVAGLTRGRKALPWALGGLGALAVVLGPDLVVNGHRLGWGQEALPLPGRLVSSRLQPVQLWLGYYGLHGLTLAVAGLAALGLDVVLRVLPRPSAPRAGALLVALALVDSACAVPGLLPVTTRPAGGERADLWLASQAGPGAVLDWPCDLDGRGDAWNQAILLHATRHGRPVGVANRGRCSRDLQGSALVLALSRPECGGPGAGAAESLRRAGFTWLVVRPRLLPPDRRPLLARSLRITLGEPLMVGPESGDAVYSLDPVVAGGGHPTSRPGAP